MLPKINLRRTYLIARRDFLGYVKTWGFWLSFIMPFVIGAIAFGAASMDINVDPVRYETILDTTGEHEDNFKAYDLRDKRLTNWRAFRNILVPKDPNIEKLSDDQMEAARSAYLKDGVEGLKAELEGVASMAPINIAKRQMDKVQDKTIYVPPPANNIDDLKPYILGKKDIMVDGKPQKLGSVLYIYEPNDEREIGIELWSTNVTDFRLSTLAGDYFESIAQSEYLEAQGLSSDGLRKVLRKAPNVDRLDPSKQSASGQDGQKVTGNDIIPFAVAVIAAGILWLTVFSGAYMLLTSMLEEKLNKLMEMMLSTTRFSEIMLGKLLGVAALTIAAMLPYILVGIAGVFLIAMSDSEIAATILKAITPKLLVFFPIFLVLGYVFYGALFIAMGSLAQSMQDAQTLTTPILLVLTGCIFVVPLGIRSPDSPILTFASWFPLSAPFAGIARLPADPPWWELCLSAFFLFLMSILVIWLASRILRFGVLSGSGAKGAWDWFKRAVLRRKA